MSGHNFLTAEQIAELKAEDAVVVLIDADIPSYSCGFACENETIWNFVEKTIDNFMMKVIREAGGTHMIGFLTVGSSNYRVADATTAEYKGNRKGTSRPKWYPDIRKYLANRWGCQVMDGIEADDALAIAQTYFNELGIKCVLASLDKDLRQVVGYHYNWDHGEIIYVDEAKAHYNLWKQMITGDVATDNIPGLSDAAWAPKVGHKIPIFETYKKVPSEPKMLKSGKPSQRPMNHVRLSHWETIDDPKQCKATADQYYGDSRAKQILENTEPEKYPDRILTEYVDAYWADGEVEYPEEPYRKGMERFEEVFRLIYMLRTVDEIPNDAVIDFHPTPCALTVLNDFDEDTVDVLDEFDDF